ncbi:hypothetical protein TMatcc_002799 [Talaromyces marneffei ATCC 18224]|uniref:Uncharacterized protein n=2 Tax=Talaromyces marneffei TaxID=37727 RepID=B6Q894_TALMQ|nr:uncharacterized protein EYB26_002113 [Talaromyces marneffei]EEA28846.1 conserved hypothetical protein [Talaromyces marneffei ATCC 18224]KAE8555543.1 hypothetical protein EYB25_000240 [Talaromyces marneffei]QGA14459.1 hypothetical protein EYB26_002113 [Talaromyces marneffei]
MASLPYLRQTIRTFTISLPSKLSTSSRVALSAAFSTSSIQRALKENDRDDENLLNAYESFNNETLKAAKSKKPHWIERLASESEADIKADRGETLGPKVDDIVERAKEEEAAEAELKKKQKK